MTAILVNKQFLTLSVDAATSLTQSNPLFDYEGVPGLWVFPFTIPYKENAAIFGYPAEPTVIEPGDEFECTLIIENSWLIKGVINNSPVPIT